MGKVSRVNYCQYLLSSQINYTLTNFADHVDGLSHDEVNRYLLENKLSPRLLWEHVSEDIAMSENGYFLFDDTVIDKNSSFKINLVRRQYSGNSHSVIKGIGLVTAVYVNPDLNLNWVIDYRVFDPDGDGKTKIDHVEDMLNHAIYKKELTFKTVLMDSWYSTHKLMLQVEDLGKLYYCPIKKNRLANDIPEIVKKKKEYQSVEDLNWTKCELSSGKIVNINQFPKNHKAKLFQITVSTRRTDFILTNDMDQNSSEDVRDVCAIRWKIEEFHREMKQLTGLEKCQCRKARIQRNHIACAMLVWVKMKKEARRFGKTIYQIKKGLLENYLISELRSPTIAFA